MLLQNITAHFLFSIRFDHLFSRRVFWQLILQILRLQKLRLITTNTRFRHELREIDLVGFIQSAIHRDSAYQRNVGVLIPLDFTTTLGLNPDDFSHVGINSRFNVGLADFLLFGFFIAHSDLSFPARLQRDCWLGPTGQILKPKIRCFKERDRFSI